MNTKHFVCLLTISLFLVLSLDSCKEDVEGNGTNPKLNYSSYIFNNRGETIELYSTLGYVIQVFYQPIAGQEDEEPEVSYYSPGLASEIKGSWYLVKFNKETKRYTVTVDENKTDKQRILPLAIMYQDWGNGRNKYSQK